MSAFGWGLLASSSLLIGAVAVLIRPPGQRTLAMIMAFGAGVLLSAVAYDLVQDAFEASNAVVLIAGLAAGALAFYVGDLLIDRMGGRDRKRSSGAQDGGGAAAIALGTVLDGVPESVVLGTTLVAGSVSWAILAAVFLSNLPESMAATTGLLKSGARPSQLMLLWGATTLVSGIAAGLGYTLLGDASGATVALVQAFAAGALLTMLTDTMIPEAYEHSGPATGLVTVLGFTVAFGISTLA
jgi:ZIP family zinc transporter